LLSSGQFIVAPTDLNNENPDPAMRPHIVNNSWGGGADTDPWYQPTVQAWVAAGIFPQFSAGNAGPGCGTAGNPGNLVESYAAGAFDINGNIASFSSRGPSAWGAEIVKPNIAAPGVNVRSSVPGGYASFNGTSMASPHVSGAVALMWSAAVAIERDITATRDLLDLSAVDTPDDQCGGTPENNNVWGQGKLDAFAAVDQSPRGATGVLSGTVTDAQSGEPVAGATVSITGEVDRQRSSDADGSYQITLPVGAYDVTVSAFGYQDATAQVDVVEGQTTVQDFALDAAPSHTVSGTVVDSDGTGVEGATVTILSTPIPPATTDANGFYSFASVPAGSYQAQATSGRCFDPQTQDLVVDGDTTLDFTLPARSDAFGYTCQLVDQAYQEAETVVPLSGDDVATSVDLPFPFGFYGETYNRVHVCSNGLIEFSGPTTTSCPFSNVSIPNTARPNGAVYPFWDDLFVDASASVRADVRGTAPERSFVIEFRNLRFFGDTTRRIDFNVVLHENGDVLTQYRNLDADGREQGSRALSSSGRCSKPPSRPTRTR
jgi:protocatechuate 3,4-dioxygenase beta subunit